MGADADNGLPRSRARVADCGYSAVFARAAAANREIKLLRVQDDGGRAVRRLRQAFSELEAGPTMLRQLFHPIRRVAQFGVRIGSSNAGRRRIPVPGHSRTRACRSPAGATAARPVRLTRRLVPLFVGTRERSSFNRRIHMKYLLLIMAALAFAGSAVATSSSDCCNGGGCCLAHLSCCAR